MSIFETEWPDDGINARLQELAAGETQGPRPESVLAAGLLLILRKLDEQAAG